jgi:hypothetical protein
MPSFRSIVAPPKPIAGRPQPMVRKLHIADRDRLRGELGE